MLITVKGAGKVGDTVVLPALIRQSNVALQRIVSSLKLIIALGIARCDAEHLVVRFELLCHILVIGRFFRQDAGQGVDLLGAGDGVAVLALAGRRPVGGELCGAQVVPLIICDSVSICNPGIPDKPTVKIIESPSGDGKHLSALSIAQNHACGRPTIPGAAVCIKGDTDFLALHHVIQRCKAGVQLVLEVSTHPGLGVVAQIVVGFLSRGDGLAVFHGNIAVREGTNLADYLIRRIGVILRDHRDFLGGLCAAYIKHQGILPLFVQREGQLGGAVSEGHTLYCGLGLLRLKIVLGEGDLAAACLYGARLHIGVVLKTRLVHGGVLGNFCCTQFAVVETQTVEGLVKGDKLLICVVYIVFGLYGALWDTYR